MRNNGARNIVRIAGVLAVFAAVLLLGGCEPADGMPPWVNRHLLRAVGAIALIPIVLVLIYKYGGNDHIGGGGDGGF